jgi:hypothetical protein
MDRARQPPLATRSRTFPAILPEPETNQKNMNAYEMTEHELVAVAGGDNAWMIWGEQAAADGLAAMDSGSATKMGIATLFASAGGYAYMLGLGWDILFD